jgi:hypothetical protein
MFYGITRAPCTGGEVPVGEIMAYGMRSHPHAGRIFFGDLTAAEDRSAIALLIYQNHLSLRRFPPTIPFSMGRILP